ncbi:MAG: PAS domain S-box protein [Treponema sp.]|jgi:PAS domain S-box-containing protein|nr:PAS domain S-box protein [Treponema sp.]
MVNFYRRALNKIDKLDAVQRKELLVSAVGEINLLETVLDSMDVGVLVCDAKNNLVMANKFAQRLFPMNLGEGVQLWEALKDEEIVGFFKNILLNREKVNDYEINIEQQDRKKLLSINVVPLVQEKRITGTLIYIEDITEKRRGEARLRRAENLASLTTLAAGVAHEIKNPLGSISIHLQLLQKAFAKKIKTHDSKIEKYFNVLKEEVNRLNLIVVDFLFAVRPMTLDLREGDINKLISQMIEFVRYELEQAKIMCLLELDEKLPGILFDERYMKQALLNLVKNAQAAMPKGGILTIATKQVDNDIRILFSDTGVGISEENLSKIFEPYFTTRESGTGLGLTQVFKIIREHKGEISVSSKEGEGTDFEILLPVLQKVVRMIEYNDKNEVKK